MIEVEISATKRTQLYFSMEKRDKKENPTDDKLPNHHRHALHQKKEDTM